MEGEVANWTEAPQLYEQIETIEVSMEIEGDPAVRLLDKPVQAPETGGYQHFFDMSPGNCTAKITANITFLDGTSVSANFTYYVSTFTPHIYRWEDNSIGTVEELQAPLDALSSYNIEEDEVTIYLPPVAYGGTLRIGSFPVKLVGHRDGDARTVIQGGIQVAPLQDWSVELSMLDFVGNGMEDTAEENRVGIQIDRIREESLTLGRFSYFQNAFRGNEIDVVNNSNLSIYFNGCFFLDAEGNPRDPIVQLTGAGGLGVD